MAWREDSDLWLTFMDRGETLVSPRMLSSSTRPPGAVWGVSLEPAAEESVQRAALQEASGALPATGAAGTSARLLRDRRLDRRLPPRARVAPAGSHGGQLRGLGQTDGGVHRAAIARDVPAPGARRRDGGDLGVDPAACRLLATPWRIRPPGAVSLAANRPGVSALMTQWMWRAGTAAPVTTGRGTS